MSGFKTTPVLPAEDDCGLMGNNYCRAALGCVLAIAIVVPLAILPGIHDVTTIKRAIFRIVIALLGCGFTLRTIRSQRLFVTITPIHLPLLCLLGLASLSLLWSGAPTRSLATAITMASYILCYMLCILGLTAPDARRVVTAMLITGACVSAYGLCQRFGIDVIHWGTDFATSEGEARVFATLGHPNFLGGYLILILALALPLMITESAKTRRLGYLLVIAVTGICMLATLSRGAWLGAGVAIVIIGGYFGRHMLSPRRIIGVAIVGLLSLVFVSERLTSLQNIPARRALWESAVRMIYDAPLLGHGSGTFETLFPLYRPEDYWLRGIELTAAHAHNEVLEVGVELGMLGIVVFIWLFIRLFRWMRTSIRIMDGARNRAILIGLTAGIAGVLTHNFFDVGLRWTAVAVPFWLVVTLAGVIAVRGEAENAQRRRTEGRPYFATVMIPPLPRIARWGIILGCFLVVGFVGVAEMKVVLADRALMEGQQAIHQRQWSDAINRFQAVLRHDPGHLSALYKLGYTFIQNGAPGRAIETLNRLEVLAPHYAEVDRNLGLAHLQLGSVPDAISRYETAARMDRIEQNWYDLGQLYEMNRDREKAVRAYETFMPLASMYLIQRRQRRDAHRKQGAMDRFASENRLIHEAQRRVRTAGAFLMEQYVASSNWEAARRVFQPRVEENPQDSQALYFLGYALQQMREYDAAIEMYTASLALNPQQAAVLNNMGVIYTEQEVHLDKAITLIQQALSLDPGDAPYYLDSLGWAYFKNGEMKRAIQTLRDGIDQCPDDKTDARAELCFHLGLVYERQGHTGLAQQYLRRSNNLAPQSGVGHRASTALKRLRQEDGQ